MKKNNIRAVFWDIDGTMVTSEPVHKAKMTYIADKHGIVLKEDIHARFHGVGDYRAYELLQELGLPGTMDEFMTDCFDYYGSQLHTIDVREGFMEAFTLLEEKGIAQGAVSNGVERLVAMNVGRAGVGNRLSVTIDLDYIENNGFRPKPHADPYLEALRKVNDNEKAAPIQPHECLVIEDSSTGVKAGKAAGMNTIYWKLMPGSTNPEADFEAYTGQDLMDILLRRYL